jgi:hypothetical protein
VRTNGFNKENEGGARHADAANGRPNGSEPVRALPASGPQKPAGTLQRILRLRAHRAAGESARILTRRQVARLSSWEDLRLEVHRSRRYGHVLSVIRLAAPVRHRRRSGAAAAAARDEVERIALAVAGLLRRLDHVWTDGEDIYLLLPEGDRAGAERLLGRVREALAVLVPDARIAIATFPEDGLSTGALVAALAGPGRAVESVRGDAGSNGGARSNGDAGSNGGSAGTPAGRGGRNGR